MILEVMEEMQPMGTIEIAKVVMGKWIDIVRSICILMNWFFFLLVGMVVAGK